MKYNNKSVKLKFFYTNSIPVTVPALREMKAASGKNVSPVIILLLLFVALLLLVHNFTHLPGIMYGFMHPFGTCGVLLLLVCLFCVQQFEINFELIWLYNHVKILAKHKRKISHSITSKFNDDITLYG